MILEDWKSVTAETTIRTVIKNYTLSVKKNWLKKVGKNINR